VRSADVGGWAAVGGDARLLDAAVALRWVRPDLTAALAEHVVEASDDPTTRDVAAAWHLHGRAAVGDVRDAACTVLHALARRGDAPLAAEGGPPRLRIELADAARSVGSVTPPVPS